jgi:hypothetical protein
MMDCKSMTTPMMTNLKKLSDSASDSDLVDPTMYKMLIGSLMYLVNTVPYIFFAMSTLGQFMVELRHVHWVSTKHVLSYLHGTVGYGLRYVLGGEVVNSNLVQYLLQTDIQKRTEKIQWQIQTLHRDFSPGNPNRENQHILY